MSEFDATTNFTQPPVADAAIPLHQSNQATLPPPIQTAYAQQAPVGVYPGQNFQVAPPHWMYSPSPPSHVTHTAPPAYLKIDMLALNGNYIKYCQWKDTIVTQLTLSNCDVPLNTAVYDKMKNDCALHLIKQNMDAGLNKLFKKEIHAAALLEQLAERYPKPTDEDLAALLAAIVHENDVELYLMEFEEQAGFAGIINETSLIGKAAANLKPRYFARYKNLKTNLEDNGNTLTWNLFKKTMRKFELEDRKHAHDKPILHQGRAASIVPARQPSGYRGDARNVASAVFKSEVEMDKVVGECTECKALPGSRVCQGHFKQRRSSFVKCSVCLGTHSSGKYNCRQVCGRCLRDHHKHLNMDTCECVSLVSGNKESTSSAYSLCTVSSRTLQALIAKPSTKMPGWIVDSGASVHMCWDRSLFIELDTTTAPSIQVADGRVQMAGGVGRVLLNANGIPLVLDEVLLVESFSCNLFSVARFRKEVSIGPNGVFIDGDVKIGSLDVAHELYFIDENIPKENQIQVLNKPQIALKVNCLSGKEIHRKFGHISSNRIAKTLELIGESTNFLDAISASECHDCATSKFKATPFGDSSHKPQDVLEIVHADLVFYKDYKSLEGYQYFLLITDGFSRYSTIFPLRNKNEVFENFRVWHSQATNATGKRLKIFRSDNGSEFVNCDFEEFFATWGVVHQRSVAYTPQQNGLAERHNGIVKDLISTLLVQSKLSHLFWPQAAHYATFLKNRLYSKVIDDVPLHLWNGHLPQLDNFQVFGCIAYGKVPSEKLRPFSDKGDKGIFVGISSLSKGYLLYSFADKKVVTYRDMKFFPSEFANYVPLPGNFPTPPWEGDMVDARDVHNSSIVDVPSVANASPFGVVMVNAEPSSTIQDDSASVAEFTSSATDVSCTPSALSELEDVHDILSATSDDTSDADVVSFSIPSPLDEPISEVAIGDNVELVANDDGVFVPEVPHDDCVAAGPLVNEALDETSCLRRSTRINFGKRKLDPQFVVEQDFLLKNKMHRAKTAQLVHSDTPTNFKDAMSAVDSDFWKCATDGEINNFISADAFEVVRAPSHCNVLPSRWLFSKKVDENGLVIAHKARFIVQGHRQSAVAETFAPTLPATTFRFLLSVAACRDWEIHQMDVSAAFLHADIDADVYIRSPEGYSTYSSDGIQDVWKLKKAVYGLKQSPKLWNNHVTKLLTKLGLKQSLFDLCLFVGKVNGSILAVVFHVDDFLIVCPSLDVLNQFKTQLKNELRIKDLGEAKKFLGIDISRNRTNRTLSLSQSTFAQDILEKFGMEHAKPLSTPLPNESIKPFEPDRGHFECPFLQVIGAITFLVTWTRPDLAYAASALSQFMMNHNEYHWKLVKHLLRYLKGTMNNVLTLGGSWDETKMPLSMYCDADHAGDQTTSRSRSGCFILFNDRPLFWKSKKQSVVVQSTCEAEYVSLGSGCQELKWILNLALDLEVCPHGPVPVYEDNQATTKISSNQIDIRKIRHLGVKYHLIRQYVFSNLVTLHYCSSSLMVADILTKPVGRIILSTCLKLLKQEGRSAVFEDPPVARSTVGHQVLILK